MLNLLKIRNIALIDELELEFGPGLNLLTGETGSGKSIIVDSLGALTGDRVTSDLIKEGEASARIEGVFTVAGGSELKRILNEGGLETDDESENDVIIRRELSAAGKNRVFINDQVVTQNLLKKIGPLLVDIHGQGEQATLFDTSTHLEFLDQFGRLEALRERVAEAYRHWSTTRTELGMLEQNEAEKLKLLDILKFQIDEISRVGLQPGEDVELEEEKRRLNNVEKLSALSEEAYTLLYESGESSLATLEKAARKVDELAEFESRFREYTDGISTARAVIEDLAISIRDFSSHLEFSPQRLEEIDDRLAEISRLKRKYGESIDAVLAHLQESEERLESIETAEFREDELRKKLAALEKEYINAAAELHRAREAAAGKFEKEVERELKAVALEKARFKVKIDSLIGTDLSGGSSARHFTPKGYDHIEFLFSANVGESPKPLARIASGGEASRLMLILKTVSKAKSDDKSAVFDEIDVGIGGRVAEAVGLKLKELAKTQQVLCVTHQPQIASLADTHFSVQKEMSRGRTTVSVKELGKAERVEEIARMLAGKTVSETAREHAREMLAGK